METLLFFVPLLGSRSLHALRYTSLVTLICATLFSLLAVALGLVQLIRQVFV